MRQLEAFRSAFLEKTKQCPASLQGCHCQLGWHVTRTVFVAHLPDGSNGAQRVIRSGAMTCAMTIDELLTVFVAPGWESCGDAGVVGVV